MQASENNLRNAVTRVLEPAQKIKESRSTQNGTVIYHMNDSGTIDAMASNSYSDADPQGRSVSSTGEPPLLANRVILEDESDKSIFLNYQRDPNSSSENSPLKIKLKRLLLSMDFSSVIAHAVSEMLVTSDSDPKTLMPQALALISNQIPIYKEDITAVGGTVAFLGATGVGKTTTIAKIATRFALRHGKDNVGLITTDNQRLAAAEQMRVYSNMLGIDYKVAHDDIELLDALNDFSAKTFVLIDTAGMGPKEICNSRFYDLFSGGITQIKNFLVVSSAMHRTALDKSTQEFSRLKLDGSIITKIDEATSLGAPLSTAILYNLPVIYFSDGQQIPDDLHLARAHVLMSRAVRVLTQFENLQRSTAESSLGFETNVNF